MNRLKKCFTWLTTAGLLALLLVTSNSITPVKAQTPPPMPGQTHQFFGTVRVNNGPAIAGTYIYAYLDGGTTAVATTTVDSQGRYGYSPLFFEVSGNNGQTVNFKVGTATAQSHLFVAGDSTNWPLSVTTTSLAVSTGAASSVGSSTATLNGTLSDMGGFNPVTVSFIYGTTPPYGSIPIAGVPPSVTSSPSTFTASLSGLTTNTTYYFVAVATSGTTTVYGTPIQFTTTLPILAVATTAATDPTANGATLNGNLVDPGNNGSVNTYFQYGTTPSYGTTTTTRVKTGATIFNEPVTGLLSGTTYHFRAVAVGTNPVETKYGDDLTLTTPVGSLSVTTGTASSVGCNSAVLYGTLTGLGGASSASTYFQYGTNTTYSNTTVTQPGTPLGSFSTAISGLAPSTTYHFKAFASTTGTPVSGSDATFITPACTGGNNLTPPNQFWGRVYVNGILASSNIPVAAYVNGVPAASTTTDSNGRYGWTTLFYVTSSSGSGTVTFYVNGTQVPQTASWTSGGMTNLDLALSGGPCTTAPGAFSLTSPISGANASGTSVTFTWTAASGAANYFLQVSTGADGTGTNIFAQSVGNVTTYTVSGFSNSGTTYYWRVNAYNDCGVTSGTVSDPRFINGGGSCTTIPGAFNLTVPANGVTVTGTPVTFTWTAASGVTDYFLQVNTNPSFPGSGNVFAASVGNVITRSVSIPNTGTYYWRVNAYNACGVRGANLPSFIRN